MRTLIGVFLIVASVVLSSCNQTSSPAATSPQFPNPGLAVSLVGYGSTLDSSYYKVWSDSSWQKFYIDTTISGTTYSVLLDDAGNETIYGPDGYSGFGVNGGYVVLFDSALASPPDTMLEGTTYVSQTTFSYQGASYVLTDQETLLDTTTVTLPFGTFTDCRVLQSVGSINGSLQYVNVYWLAKGPSDIVRQDYTGYTIQMAYGVVNGQDWGITGRALPEIAANQVPAAARPAFPTTTNRAAPDIRSLAPMILKGIVR